MTQPDDSELLPLRYRPQPESARFWLCLGLGSIAVHAIALYVLGQATGGTGPTGQRDRHDRSMPVELIGPRVPASPAPAVDRPARSGSLGASPSPGTSAIAAPARPVTPASSALPNFRPLSPEQLGQRIDQQNRNPIAPPQPPTPVTDPSFIQPPWPGQTLPPGELGDRPNPGGQPPTNPADRPTGPSQPPTQPPNPNNPGNPQASGEGPATPGSGQSGAESGQSGQGITLVINSMDLAQGNTDRLASGDLTRQPQPHQTQASNLGLAYTPALAAIFGQAIELSLAVGLDGSVLPGSVRILTPGLTPAASNAAKDLALRLTFEPGLDHQGRPIAVNLRAIVVLQKINS